MLLTYRIDYTKFGSQNFIKNWINDLLSHTYNSKYVRNLDRTYYMFNLVCMFTTIYLLGASPDKYFFYWTLGMHIVLCFKRLVYFWQYDYQLFLMDYCYFANIVQWMFILYYPDSRMFYILNFAISGMCNVVLYVKDMILIHDPDKLFASNLHLMAIVVTWNIHWNIRGTPGRAAWNFYDPELIQFDLQLVAEMMTYYGIFYVIYATYYYGILSFLWGFIMKKDLYCFLRERCESPEGKAIQRKYGYKGFFIYFAIVHIISMFGFTLSMVPCMFSNLWCIAHMLFCWYVVFNRGADNYINKFPVRYHKHLAEYDKHGKLYDPVKIRHEFKR